MRWPCRCAALIFRRRRSLCRATRLSPNISLPALRRKSPKTLRPWCPDFWIVSRSIDLGARSRNGDLVPEAEASADMLHFGLRLLIGPCGAFVALSVNDQIVELHAMRAFE